MKQRLSSLALASVLSGLFAPRPAQGEIPKPYGLLSRPAAKAYLRMPERVSVQFPRLLSETGAFKSTRDLIPAEGLIPYDLNFSFWSDGAAKARWISVPNDATHPAARIRFAPTGEWAFPNGTVFVKHFELATNEMQPGLRRRLETRLLVREAGGSVYGVTYKCCPPVSRNRFRS